MRKRMAETGLRRAGSNGLTLVRFDERVEHFELDVLRRAGLRVPKTFDFGQHFFVIRFGRKRF